MNRKTFQAETKSLNPDGTVTVYVSPAVIDRDGEYIDPKEWILDEYKKHPVLLSMLGVRSRTR